MGNEYVTIKINKEDYEIVKELAKKQERSLIVTMRWAILTYKQMLELQEKYYAKAGLVNLERLLSESAESSMIKK